MNILPNAVPGESWLWDEGYFGNVTSRLDFVLPMLYESGFNTTESYMQWVEQQISLNSEYSKAPVIYSLPNWYENTKWHHPWAENLENAIQAFQSYMTNNESSLPASNMMGLAIYSLNASATATSTETTSADWNYFMQQWVDSNFSLLATA